MIYDLQKASMWKRISAFLFDGILLGVVAVLLAFLLSAALGYDRYADRLDARYAAFEAEYGVDMHPSMAEYDALTDAQKETLDAAYEAIATDTEAVYAYRMTLQLTLLITSIGLLLAFLLMEFLIPLGLGNGQTLGKKIFGLAVMRADGVKISAVVLFVRTVLGKYTLETMVPLLIIMMIFWGSLGLTGTLLLFALLVLQAALLIATRTNSLLHDLLASTVCVDMASQMIFNSKEEMIAYKQKAHAEKVARQPA